MARTGLAERVDRLEEMMMRLAYTQMKTEMEIQALKEEMKAFKDEMLEFKNEMKAFKDEMKAFKDEMLEFKNEMKAFKDEMRAWREEVDKDRKAMNKRWGELANKMGTLVEDIVAPAFPEVIERRFGGDILMQMINVKVKDPEDRHRTKEFDLIAVSEKAVYWCEVKSNPNMECIERFVEALKEKELFRFFPGYRDKELVGVFASLNLPEEVVNYLSRRGVYAMGMKGEYMDILNFEEVRR
ncbi:MAG: hypothetical protein PWP09_1760 [Thermotogota bacterium]|nr:hypothetical protein [Thermotogota bacterium]